MKLPVWFAHWIARPRVSRAALMLATAIDRPLMRVSGGRLRLSFVIPVLLLRTRGARSGEPRETPLLYAPDGQDAIVVASNGGREREPAWAHNLRAHPRVECLLRGSSARFEAVELAGEAHARAFARACEIYPGFERYTERLARPIAVFHLRRIGGACAGHTGHG